MKNRILKLVTEPIFIDTFFIILGFILLRNIKVSEVNFTNTTNILLAIGVVFMVMHFDNLKEIVKKKTLSKEDIKDYHDFLFELILILLIAYLFFLVYIFDLNCLKYIVLSLSFGLFSALVYTFTFLPLHFLLETWKREG